jgi:hypothetical protein
MPAFSVWNVRDLPEYVELHLLIGRVANSHRGFLIAGQPGNIQFRQPALPAHSVQDLHLVRAAGNSAEEPVSPSARLLVIPEVHER